MKAPPLLWNGSIGAGGAKHPPLHLSSCIKPDDRICAGDAKIQVAVALMGSTLRMSFTFSPKLWCKHPHAHHLYYCKEEYMGSYTSKMRKRNYKFYRNSEALIQNLKCFKLINNDEILVQHKTHHTL